MDLSVNGTYVNGERVGRQHLLARADVIRIGHDEFRFYADARPAPAPMPARGRCRPRRPAHPPTGRGQPAVRYAARAALTDAQARAVAAPGQPQPAVRLASLLVRTGALRGGGCRSRCRW